MLIFKREFSFQVLVNWQVLSLVGLLGILKQKLIWINRPGSESEEMTTLINVNIIY